jgi:hypothetical protein
MRGARIATTTSWGCIREGEPDAGGLLLSTPLGRRSSVFPASGFGGTCAAGVVRGGVVLCRPLGTVSELEVLHQLARGRDQSADGIDQASQVRILLACRFRKAVPLRVAIVVHRNSLRLLMPDAAALKFCRVRSLKPSHG